MRSWKRLSVITALAIGLTFPSSVWGAAKIVIDAGHGGSDPGAIGVNGLQEKTHNLDIALKLGQALQAKGYEISQVRWSDVYVSLKDRVAFTEKQADADLFVSIHANAHPSSNVRGTLVLYYDDAYPNPSYPASEAMKALTPESKTAAQSVQDALVSSLGLQDRGLLPSSVYVVRMGSIPSILVETAFLSNAADAALLADPNFRTRAAQAIADGIERYLPADNIEAVFNDIRKHWAKDAVKRLYDASIVKGTGRGYEPERPLTRAEWTALLDRALGLSAEVGVAANEPGSSVAEAVYGDLALPAIEVFTDVKPEHWAYELLVKAVQAGLLNGYEDHTLRPDGDVTRAEVTALLRRLVLPDNLDEQAELEQRESISTSIPPEAAQAEIPVNLPFSDVPLTHWAYDDITAMKEAGFINGITEERFAPDRPMTRAEAAALLDRILQMKSNDINE